MPSEPSHVGAGRTFLSVRSLWTQGTAVICEIQVCADCRSLFTQGADGQEFPSYAGVRRFHCNIVFSQSSLHHESRRKRGEAMPSYMKLGSVPRKRHIAHRREAGYRGEGIYYEEVLT